MNNNQVAIGGSVQKPVKPSHLPLVHANDQEIGDDFQGGRNWTFMLVLFSALAAGVSSSAAIISYL